MKGSFSFALGFITVLILATIGYVYFGLGKDEGVAFNVAGENISNSSSIATSSNVQISTTTPTATTTKESSSSTRSTGI